MAFGEQRRKTVVVANLDLMRRQKLEQPDIGRLHCGLFVLVRLSVAIIEMIDIHVVMVKRPAGGLRLRKIGIAVSRVQPGAADIERNAEMLIAGPGAAADTVHRFEQLEGKAGRTQGLGGGKSRRTGADDHDVNVFHEYFSPRHNNYLIVSKFSGIRQRCGEDA